MTSKAEQEAEWIEDGYLDKPIVCSHCGTESESETNYCSYCGRKMKKGWWHKNDDQTW